MYVNELFPVFKDTKEDIIDTIINTIIYTLELTYSLQFTNHCFSCFFIGKLQKNRTLKITLISFEMLVFVYAEILDKEYKFTRKYFLQKKKKNRNSDFNFVWCLSVFKYIPKLEK